MRATKLTLPSEHGALVTLAGAAAAAALLAPRPAHALAAAAAIAASYLARGPIERRVKGLRLRPLDAPALALYAAIAVAATAAVAPVSRHGAIAIAAIAAAIPLAGALTRSARLRRSVLVETGGMIAVGASAGAELHAGGGGTLASITVAIALASYAAAAIFLVRAQTRPLSRRGRLGFAAIAAATLALGAATTAALAARLAWAFAPRGAHALARLVWVRESRRVTAIALRESLELALFVALLAWLA